MTDWKPGDIRTVQLGEHTWSLPPIPAKKDILFWDKPILEQHWRRQTDFPETFEAYSPLTKINAEYTQWEDNALLSLSRADTETLITLRERELQRRREGIWFMNKGVPEYITGDHYFTLQWSKMAGVRNKFDGGAPYGHFRRFQQKVFYEIALCVHNDYCLGGFWPKPKKTGLSLLFAARELNQSTMTPEWNIGMMSKSHDDCKDTLMRYYKFGLDGLPYIFKPSLKTDNLDEIEFGNPRIRNTGSKASQMKQMENGKGFNTKVFAAPTKEDAFDGPVMNEILWDEPSKCEDPYPELIFQKMSKTVKLGELLNGKLFMFNYVNEKDGRAFTEARKIYYDSKIKTIDPVTKMTKSELFAFFVCSLDSLETIDNQFDVYGDVDREKNKAYILAKRESLKNDRQALQGYIRQFPITEEECWRFGGASGSSFDNIRLGKRLSIVNEDLAVGNLPYVMGDLAWSGDRLNSEVRFIRTPEKDVLEGRHGKFRLYGIETLSTGPLSHRFNIPIKQNIRDDYGRLKPRLDCPFIASTDPTDYALKQDVKVGSLNAITAMTFPSTPINTYFGKMCTGRGMLRYLHRPNNPKEYYEDLVKVLFWLGCYIYPEANKPWLITNLKEDNLHNFILVRDGNKMIVPYKEYEHQKLPHTTKDVIGEMVRIANEYYAPPTFEGEFDLMDTIDDEEEIQQLMEFDVADTKRFDLAVCKLNNIMAMQSFMGYRVRMAGKENAYSTLDMQEVMKQLIY